MNGLWKHSFRIQAYLSAILLILCPGCESQPTQSQNPFVQSNSAGGESFSASLIKEEFVDGFETKSEWFVEPPDSQWVTDASKLNSSKQYTSQGKYSLEANVDFNRGLGRAHIKRSFEHDPGNWSDYSHVLLDISVEYPGRIRLGLHSKDWEYQQTESVPLRAGTNKNIAISLDPISPETLGNFLLLTIELSGYSQSQKLYLDNLRVAKFEPDLETLKGSHEGNLAFRCPLKVSSVDEWKHPAKYAVDGSIKTRWSSKYTDKQYWILDFRKPVEFNAIVLYWESAYPTRYDLWTSMDGESWTPLYRQEEGIGGKETITTELQHARYLKWQGRRRGTPYGYSLYEIEVFRWKDCSPGFKHEGKIMNRIQPVLNFHPLIDRNPVALQPPRIRSISFTGGKSVGKFERIEFSVEFDASWTNPYDPADIDVKAFLKSPSGHEYEIPGFYYWPFNRQIVQEQEQLLAGEKPFWLFRFTPTQVGQWSGYIKIQNQQGKTSSESFDFHCQSSSDPGFIQVARKNPNYFEFQNGDLYFPIGLNVCWYLGQSGEDNLQTLAYDRWLQRLADNGVNYIRLWMWPMGFCPEWYDTGLGDYDLRQPNLWRLDYVLEKCESLGIYAMVSLINHGQFSSRTNAEWDSNPYSKENGGMLDSPDQFLTDPEARKFFSRRLRYLMARYGYSPHIFSWEWFNEVEWTDGLAGKDLIPWMEEMDKVIRTYDPNPHLVTVSSKERGSPLIWNSPTIDFTQVHEYNCRNWAPEIAKQIQFMKTHYKRPVFMAEFGLELDYLAEDPTGVHLRVGNWASLMSGASGGAMSWWWDQYVDFYDLYPVYRGFSSYMAGETLNLSDYKPDKSLHISDPQIEVYSLRNTHRILFWIRDRHYSIAGLSAFPDRSPTLPIKDALLKVPDASTPFQVEWWNTKSGKIIGREHVLSHEKGAEIPVPSFNCDIAGKIIFE